MQLSDFAYWIDANLHPKTSDWLQSDFGVESRHVFNMDFLAAEDAEIFSKARQEPKNVIIIPKDEDFVELVLRKKPPPKIIWITAGNLSNKEL